jgi:hypothetical protein
MTPEVKLAFRITLKAVISAGLMTKYGIRLE